LRPVKRKEPVPGKEQAKGKFIAQKSGIPGFQGNDGIKRELNKDMTENYRKGSFIYSAVPSRHTPAERMAIHLVALFAWPFEKLSLRLRLFVEKLHDLDLGIVDF